MSGENILIVEDNPSNLKFEEAVLSSLGYNVRSATNATIALNILLEFQPHLIVMDIQLPGQSGLELTRTLKMNPEYQNIIIVAVTAYAMLGDKDKILAAGCDAYITKPLDIDTFASVIADLILQHSR